MVTPPRPDADLVRVGVVGKPFGVRGACYVRPDPDVVHEFAPGRRYRAAGPWTGDLEIASWHLHGRRTVATFVGVSSRAEAERLRGAVLAVARHDVDLPEEALWADEVTGARVVTVDGAPLGRVTALADGPAHDYLVVSLDGGGEVLVPAVAELVTIESGTDADVRVVVEPLPGLLDPSLAEDAPPAAPADRPAGG